MKQILLIMSIFLFSSVHAWSQEKSQTTFPMLGDEAPAFKAESTSGTVNFPGDYHNDWKILFSHPADFTPVCSSEILELAEAEKNFEKLGTKIIVVSVDQLENHLEWKKSMESVRFKDKEPLRINFPLVSDPNMNIARMYGMIHPGSSSTKDVRGVYIIDPQNKIRAMFFYPMNIGRNIGEIERTLVALQTANEKQVLIPANWQPGSDVLLPFGKTQADDAKLSSEKSPDDYELTWYMRYRKVK